MKLYEVYPSNYYARKNWDWKPRDAEISSDGIFKLEIPKQYQLIITHNWQLQIKSISLRLNSNENDLLDIFLVEPTHREFKSRMYKRELETDPVKIFNQFNSAYPNLKTWMNKVSRLQFDNIVSVNKDKITVKSPGSVEKISKIYNYTPQSSQFDLLDGIDYCVNCGEILFAEGLDEDLKKWFKEKWVRFGPDGKIRGDCARGSSSEGKPKCLPQSKAHALGKKGRATAASRKRREDPNKNRRGPAKNVKTK